jgi:transposase
MGRHNEVRKEILRRKGFIMVSEAAQRCSRSVWTIYRWLEDGKVEGARMEGEQYVTYRSLYNFIGQEEARMLGMPDPARPK